MSILCSISAYASDRVDDGDVDVMQEYHCVDVRFKEESGKIEPLNMEQNLTRAGISLLASRLHNPVRQAMIVAAGHVYQEIDAKNENKYVDPSLFFERFITHLSEELPRQMNVVDCSPERTMDDSLADAVFDVAVNRYVSGLIGRGKIHQWFLNNGGAYVQSSFIVSMAAIDLSGRRLDIEAWKKYYRHYVKDKFPEKSQ